MRICLVLAWVFILHFFTIISIFVFKLIIFQISLIIVVTNIIQIIIVVGLITL